MQIVISTLLILSGLAIGAGLGLALRPIDSPAEAAGIRAGDVITEVDGQIVRGPKALLAPQEIL